MPTPLLSRPPVIAAAIASTMILAAVAVLTYYATPRLNHPNHSDLIPGVDQPQAESAPQPQVADPTAASLTPGGTDLLLGIGAGDHLVAVCDLDEDRDGIQDLPRIGDFDHIDWEKLAAIRPKLLITQFGARMPPGLHQRCQELGIRQIDIKLDVLDDIYAQADKLGAILGEESKERHAVNELKRRLMAIAKASAGMPPLRVAIAMSEGGSFSLIGPGSFHDQLLTIAGGVNVAAPFAKPYVVIDREQLAALAPDVVLDLEPAPPTSMQEMRQVVRYWASLPDLPAVRNHRVYTITVPYCRRPGWHVADLAEIFAADLRGTGK